MGVKGNVSMPSWRAAEDDDDDDEEEEEEAPKPPAKKQKGGKEEARELLRLLCLLWPQVGLEIRILECIPMYPTCIVSVSCVSCI